MLPGCDFYLAAFWELNSDRPVGMGVAPIPFTSIDRFAVRHGVEGEDFDFFTRMMRAMDGVALAYWSERQDGQQTKANVSSRPAREVFDAIWG